MEPCSKIAEINPNPHHPQSFSATSTENISKIYCTEKFAKVDISEGTRRTPN